MTFFFNELREWANNIGKKKSSLESKTSHVQNVQNKQVKILVVGPKSCGKSVFIETTCGEEAQKGYLPTLGVDVKIIKYELSKNSTITCQIWDTSGDDRVSNLVTSYYRGADAVIVMFDTNSMDAQSDVLYWIQQVNRYSSIDLKKQLFVIGTKTDLKDRYIPEAQMRELIDDEYSVPYFEVTYEKAKDNVKIMENIASKVAFRDGAIDKQKIREPQVDH